MTVPAGKLEAEDEAAPEENPQVFVRTFTTPSGMPWDQSRASQLEARHGAPLPIADLMFRVRRLEAWRFGEPARYAVFYLRRRDYRGPFETIVDVDGEPIRVAYGSTGDPLKRLGLPVFLFLLFVMTGSVLGGGLFKVVALRQDANQQLELLERAASAKLRQAQRLKRRQRQNQDLATVKGDAGSPADVLADLAWVQHAKTPDARIVVVHWDHGLLAIEARGSEPPIIAQDREIVRSKSPLRPGVWLWGVNRTPAPARDSVTSAEFGP